MHETSTMRGAGSTSGGIGTVLCGLVMTKVGGLGMIARSLRAS